MYFHESVGYCTLHDKEVTRYNGCYQPSEKVVKK